MCFANLELLGYGTDEPSSMLTAGISFHIFHLVETPRESCMNSSCWFRMKAWWLCWNLCQLHCSFWASDHKEPGYKQCLQPMWWHNIGRGSRVWGMRNDAWVSQRIPNSKPLWTKESEISYGQESRASSVPLSSLPISRHQDHLEPKDWDHQNHQPRCCWLRLL